MHADAQGIHQRHRPSAVRVGPSRPEQKMDLAPFRTALPGDQLSDLSERDQAGAADRPAAAGRPGGLLESANCTSSPLRRIFFRAPGFGASSTASGRTERSGWKSTAPISNISAARRRSRPNTSTAARRRATNCATSPSTWAARGSERRAPQKAAAHDTKKPQADAVASAACGFLVPYGADSAPAASIVR